MLRRNATALFCFMFVIFSAASLCGETFGWRGDGSGRFPDAKPPESWSKDTNIVWTAELPGRGFASPVLHDGRVYILSEPAELVCFDAAGGEQLWQATVGYIEALGEKKAAEIDSTHKRLDAKRKVVKDRYNALRKENPEAKGLDSLSETV